VILVSDSMENKSRTTT